VVPLRKHGPTRISPVVNDVEARRLGPRLVALFVASGARLHAPDLQAWLDRGEHALESPYPAERVVRKVVRST
jgi:hypothetical protein